MIVNICQACGYPVIGPGLCAACLPAASARRQRTDQASEVVERGHGNNGTGFRLGTGVRRITGSSAHLSSREVALAAMSCQRVRKRIHQQAMKSALPSVRGSSA